MAKNIYLKSFYCENRIEAGCDEAGRGPLAGPVFAAAVILPRDFTSPTLNDSKQMSAKERDKMRKIIETVSIAWAVEAVYPSEIDEINILNASIVAMQRAVIKLSVKPDLLLIDGNRFKPMEGYEYKTFIKGDGIFTSIAAASVLAKTHRDEFMKSIANKYPDYGWEHNMGYPTKEHIEAIRKLGYTEWHRRSFHPKELEDTLWDNNLL